MNADERSPTPIDWQAWHTDYEDADSPLSRRLKIVQRHITDVLDSFAGSPLRVVSMCAGEGRDLLGALDRHERRDVRGVLVELDPVLASAAREHAAALGLDDLVVRTGDAGVTSSYGGAVPADLVLACGVFGNISDEDVERTVRTLPMFCAPGAAMIWTRHRREPDLTVAIRRWIAESGFTEVAFEPLPDSPSSVGVERFDGVTPRFVDQPLFTFNRTAL